MATEVSRQSSGMFPLINDIRCRTLSLSLGDPIDEAAADAKKQIQEQQCETCLDSPRSVLLSSAQLGAYHPMEDKIYINEAERLYGIFDGHGGDICSRYISEKVPKLVLDKLARQRHRNDVDYACVLKSSFIEADTSFLNEHKFMLKNSPTGSCGVVVLERDGYLYVCNLGDSRVQLAKTDEHGNLHTLLLTNDHNTKNPKEVRLVLERTSDPFPIRSNINTNTEGLRVGGVLMLTRAFGDGVFKRKDMSMPPFMNHLPYITSEPEINVHKIEPHDKFVVIASDGLYELLTPQQITAFVGELLEECRDSPKEIAKIGCKVIHKVLETIARIMKKTVEEVKNLPNRKTFMDDTTVIVLLLNSK